MIGESEWRPSKRKGSFERNILLEDMGQSHGITMKEREALTAKKESRIHARLLKKATNGLLTWVGDELV